MDNKQLVRWVNKNWDSMSPVGRESVLDQLRTRARGLQPDLGLQLCLAIHLADAGYREESTTLLDFLTTKDPTVRVAWLALAHVEEDCGNLRRALQAYERALSLTETASTAICAASAANQLGEIPTAEKLYRLAISIEPENEEAWSGLGVMLGLQGRREQARSAFEQALKFDPNSEVALRESALLSEHQDEKISLLESLTTRNPNDFWAWLYLGMAYYAKQEFRKAASALKSADELDSNGESLLWQYRALVCAALGELREAIALARRALDAGIDDPALRGIASEESD